MSLSNPATATILVVDDEPSIGEIARLALEARGYRVLVAADAETALALSSQHPGRLDLVVTDLGLPDMNGSTLVSRLTARWPDVMVLYISGSLDETAPRPGTKVAYLSKPFTPRQLVEAVSICLASRGP